MEKQFNGKNHFKDGNAKKPKSKTDFEEPNDVLNRNSFDNNWIIEGADAKLPDFAEALGKYMANNELTNSKIRSIYGEIKRIQMGKFEHTL